MKFLPNVILVFSIVHCLVTYWPWEKKSSNSSPSKQGGILVLEPQPWKSYDKNHKVSEVIFPSFFLIIFLSGSSTVIALDACQVLAAASFFCLYCIWAKAFFVSYHRQQEPIIKILYSIHSCFRIYFWIRYGAL